MSSKIIPFDLYVEKIILHHQLVPLVKLNQAKVYQKKYPDLSLLQILVRAKLIQQKHAEMIVSKYKAYSVKKGSDVQGETPEKTPEPVITQAVPKPPPEPPKPADAPQQASMTMPDSSDNDVEKTLHESEDVAPINWPPTQSRNKDEAEEEEAAPSAKTSRPPLNIHLAELLAHARHAGASDLHINVNSTPLIRQDGLLKSLNKHVMSAAETERLLFDVLSDDEKRLLRGELALDTCCTFNETDRYRACFTKQTAGWDGAFRIISNTVPTFTDLKLPDSLRRLTDYHDGLVLITGPSGSGKSTTLAAMIELVNQTRHDHIITLEDPVEFVFKPTRCHISQRQVGAHTQSFSMALRAALREDPDVIMIGELRDLETTSLAISAAETGHLVFATLHTTSASQTVHRILDFFPPDQRNQIKNMVSESLRGVVCQQLVPRKEGGRALALEVMFNIHSIANLIREDRIFQLPNMIQINNQRGMTLMDESIMKLLKEDVIEGHEAWFAADDKSLFKQWAPGFLNEKEDAHGES